VKDERDGTPPWLSLGDDEEILYKSNPNYVTAVQSVLFGFVVAWVSLGGQEVSALLPFDEPNFVIPWYVFAVVVVYDLAVPVRALVPLRFNWYVVTDRRIVVKEGVLRTDTQSQTHDSVQEIRMSRSPFEKLLALTNVADVADFKMASAGTSMREMSLRNVRNP